LIRQKLEKKQNLSVSEITDVMDYLLSKEPRNNNETQEETRDRHHSNTIK
jgi:hypothetical protein